MNKSVSRTICGLLMTFCILFPFVSGYCAIAETYDPTCSWYQSWDELHYIALTLLSAMSLFCFWQFSLVWDANASTESKLLLVKRYSIQLRDALGVVTDEELHHELLVEFNKLQAVAQDAEQLAIILHRGNPLVQELIKRGHSLEIA